MPDTDEIIVESVLDDFGRLRVTEAYPYRFLIFGENTEQSCCYLPDPTWLEYDYTRAMLLGFFWAREKPTVSVLGLGGGSLANCALAHFAPEQVTAVELRPAVVELAVQWLRLADDSRLQVVRGCADTYLQAQPGSCDLMLVDLYMEGGLSRLQLEGDFFRACRRALHPQGVLVINQWQQRDNGEPFALQMLRDVLGPGALRSEVKEGNVLLFVPANGTLSLDQVAMQQWADDLEPRLGYSLRPFISQLRPL
ncbi:spermidine synthase [Halopseudomonas salegens]|uniref:Spermidine synthase n=1 Tax=Halopseudomonas salegens TaxID=1434072 RepID=A0A1H2FR90_9GAMM|nr:methyltransferase domain-containing protein [Halopseudomonas salegens]SDU09863.1 Spermidine synthase [Halopseudomonas salegens]